MHITANGERFSLQKETTLQAFVEDRGLALERVVIEKNGQALTPTEARETTLADGDQLEIVRIVAGG